MEDGGGRSALLSLESEVERPPKEKGKGKEGMVVRSEG